jgi:hypothetical protein
MGVSPSIATISTSRQGYPGPRCCYGCRVSTCERPSTTCCWRSITVTMIGNIGRYMRSARQRSTPHALRHGSVRSSRSHPRTPRWSTAPGGPGAGPHDSPPGNRSCSSRSSPPHKVGFIPHGCEGCCGELCQSLELHAAHQAMAATLERPDEAPSKKAVGIAELPYTLRSRR